MSPDGTRAYVADDTGVEVIDTATKAVVKTIALSHSGRIAINPDGTRVYVTRDSDDDVKVISTASQTVVKTIPVGDSPRPIVINAAGTRAYVANIGCPDSISVLDLTNDTFLTQAASNGVPLDRAENLAITPDGATVLATARW
jgi:YVTN family beta-propeller protein